MLQTIETRPMQAPPAEQARPCPLCGAEPYWQEFEMLGEWHPHFSHPGVVTDDGCLLSGVSYHGKDLNKWNRRAASLMIPEGWRATTICQPLPGNRMNGKLWAVTLTKDDGSMPVFGSGDALDQALDEACRRARCR